MPKPLKILHVVGARPNFMKVAPILRSMTTQPQTFTNLLVHTGQHYDVAMSDVFFDELDLPRPDVNLGVGSGSHASQTAQVMLAFEPVVHTHTPDWVFVVGDVNSTLAASLVCAKLGIPVAHVEAGLRSFDRSMPEEINRLLTDQMAEVLFTPSADGDENLIREGIQPGKIHRVGNVMIDTLVHLLPRAKTRLPGLLARLGVEQYILATLHRPANVDDPAALAEIVRALSEASAEVPVLFPVHPRTRRALIDHQLMPEAKNLVLLEPLGYLDFLALQTQARLVVTDSGGIQEETTFLGVPCLTVRPNTERPVTITHGTNELVDYHRDALAESTKRRLNEPRRASAPPELWDGHTADRITAIMAQFSPVPLL